ncbi:preprotein translocase subunit SecY [Brachyspira aalborgi]|jgi:preprotein translocase subunit SecY|uniref:Protein translocase subunit SecY n=1 Tax=Brachyspira aalborgi TaxID=29522 RepID=A0A5C8D1H9_9SPIR|nr:preprotein translocase subunit SecY [Brachyspira aalborgi]MBS4762867.1 preprotein translocase subunit SecY [Brachyspira sp.]CCY76236.1 protein translocase subunit SecY [Brachyspira sp. CAG:700]TXJ14426.1 preprotein translocase subunit SecY [Brachyspira aalborgi]TXJ19204.1 preprotein translocase subunit SecY [Brachyspira aalborgi]TXJ31315.1 preprotein translocase subunit SecY [Brachyspira aalborgi]
MFKSLTNIFRVQELRDRILYTVMAILVYRIGSHIPTPGIDPTALLEFLSSAQGGGGLLTIMDLFSGGALFRFSILALGIMPYISASIIMQLLGVVIPALERMQKEGESGRKKINQYVRYLALVLCIIQSAAMASWIQSINEGAMIYMNPGLGFVLIVVATATAGTMFLMWLGDQITERGLGNGISVIIFAGIVARIPAGVYDMIQKKDSEYLNSLVIVLFFIIFAIVIFCVVYEESGQRRIPVQYAKRVVGRKVFGAQSTHIPFKINPSGVIPIIFASALMAIPAQIASLTRGIQWRWLDALLRFFSYGSWAYIILYCLLVIMFAYVYTSVQFNPDDIAENLKKQGGFIPGYRPGTQTAEYLKTVLGRITIGGSIFLAAIAVFPDLMSKIPIFAPFKGSNNSLVYLMGGTSVMISVSVAVELLKQIESYLQMHNYDGILKKSKARR